MKERAGQGGTTAVLWRPHCERRGWMARDRRAGESERGDLAGRGRAISTRPARRWRRVPARPIGCEGSLEGLELPHVLEKLLRAPVKVGFAAPAAKRRAHFVGDG